ncbi:MAG TPA: T9SS type A sorting domain-containing protein [Balneolales bacterium]|nr:T9SS type A sorting domain-containing protein [Balneolales bacterium]
MLSGFYCSRSRTILCLLLLFITHNYSYGQQKKHNITFAPDLLKGSREQLSSTASTGTIHIVAVMVDFQADNTRFTSGNGKFGTSIKDTTQSGYFNPKNITIDPLPHDRNYFLAHLKFAKNYFDEVSNGKLTIDYRLLPKVYHLNNKMATYSPLGETDAENYKLADLVRDTWQAVNQEGGFDTSGLQENNTVFVIFHAGTGREFDFTGTSLDHTPEDIPSLFLSQKSLGSLLKQPGFKGFPIGNSSLNVTNSIIMPETESHLGTDVSGSRYILQFSMNGLLCATIGSYLGLPDLYNTNTGASGIGRFGLMDPESFFAYQGLFPPEPSAWEKIFLGWQTPFDISLNPNKKISLPASSLHQPNSIARQRISNNEYFLVENRDRDPEKNGITLTIQQPDGKLVQQHFSDQSYFNQQYPDSIIKDLKPGVVVKVDDYDWSLPGGVDRGNVNNGIEKDRILNGGILIWHIDNGVIQQKIAENAINNNINRKGVNLMEADGAQDIGHKSLSIFLSSVTGGTAFDFWFKGNDASSITQAGDTLQLYQNKFGYNTHPNNRSNTGSPSYFEFYDFSPNQPVANFRAKTTAPDWFSRLKLLSDTTIGRNIQNTETYNQGYPLGLSIYTTNTDTSLIIPSPQKIYTVNLTQNANQRLSTIPYPDPHQPYIGKYLILTHNAALTDTGSTVAYTYKNGNWQTVWKNTDISSSLGFISSNNDDTLHFDYTKPQLLIKDGSTLPIQSAASQTSKPVNGVFSYLSDNHFQISNHQYDNPNTFGIVDSRRRYTGSLITGPQNNPGWFALFDHDLFLIHSATGGMNANYQATPIIQSTNFNWPAFADINGNGNIDFLYIDTQSNQLLARNSSGAVLSRFPKNAPDGTHYVGTPLIVDLDGNGKPDILTEARDSVSYVIHAYDQSLKELPNFPLYVGDIQSKNAEPIHPVFYHKTLYAVSPDGDLQAWYFPKSKKAEWSSQYGNGDYNKVYALNELGNAPKKTFRILNKIETYNWPNPANQNTYVRYETNGQADVHITIITMNGQKLYDRTVTSTGNVPQEIRIATNNWGNGVYYARIRAVKDHHSESKLIKIAVVH